MSSFARYEKFGTVFGQVVLTLYLYTAGPIDREDQSLDMDTKYRVVRAEPLEREEHLKHTP